MSKRTCEHCGARGGDFQHEGHDLCAECMNAFTSWLLDGGMQENPEQFAYMLESV
jgi:protein-arginine kinase activator protein McsA